MMRNSLTLWGLVAGLIALVPLAAAWQPDIVLRVNRTVTYSDCFPRDSIVINGTAPGPLLRLTEGQHYWIRVYNDVPDANTTVHWHGFTQYLSPFSDGTPLGSGWPIPPGHFYDYEFQLEPGFVGTYWYHSHVGMQDMTAYGPIIVDPAGHDDCPVQYDEDLVLVTSDYYHESHATWISRLPESELTRLLLNETMFTWVGDPQTLLVNGHGPYNCNASLVPQGMSCADRSQCGVPQIFVKPATRYRVRVIATGALSYLQMALESHNISVFEVDGTYIEPLPITDLQIQIGQRYSILVETMANPPQHDYYWRLRTMWRPTRSVGAIRWTYRSDADCGAVQTTYSLDPPPADLASRVFLPNETFGWVDSSFKMVNQTETYPADSEVTKQIWLDDQQITWGPTGKALRWAVNNRLYNETIPERPILLDMYEMSTVPNYTAAALNGGFDEVTRTYPVKLGEVLDIIIQAIPGPSNLVEAHPWHSHGLKYWDMGAGMGNFSYEALAETLKNRTGAPFLRDTSVAYPGPGASYIGQKVAPGTPGGWRLLRIKVTDPGLWLLHCHITFHQMMGMMVPLLYGGESLPEIPLTLVQEYMQFGGGAFGKPTYDYWGQDNTPYEPQSYHAMIAERKKANAGGKA